MILLQVTKSYISNDELEYGIYLFILMSMSKSVRNVECRVQRHFYDTNDKFDLDSRVFPVTNLQSTSR